ncbi:hypothetical protein O1611_g9633 [Lasiodiplodia mahajangana]|uniref:Uncharacterized protein n=1 Tax=Lasiodiplodia mahajangana TaxID=1108764 RepID=A0ACC2J7F3_9PEZI|nr:hypothetical protein O1611_g9633 [Lasiodiplodia mahajangana]
MMLSGQQQGIRSAQTTNNTYATMAAGDLIDFDVIEGQKENIQSLPGGRSAKKLAEAFSHSPLHKLETPTPADTKNINDCIRAEYEAEVAALSESDDPLDVFDRYSAPPSTL